MRLPHIRSTVRWLGLLIALGILGGAGPAEAQLPPEQLRFVPVIADGFYWHRAIEQDAMGFLWIGTEGGLTRYDGYEGRHYDTDPSDANALPHNFITSIAAGPDGRLWVSFGGATGWLDPTSGAYHDATDAFGWGLAFDGAGALWGIDAASEDAPWGVRRWILDGTPERVAPFGEEAGLNAFAELAPRLVADAEGRVWIPGHTLGLTRADPRPDGGYDLVRWRPAELGARAVYDVRAGGDGSLWVRTDLGFHRWTEHDGFALALAIESVPEDARRVHDFLVDRRGVLWLASASTNGALAFDPATGDHVRLDHNPESPSSLPDARVTHLAEDRTGVLWFGTTAGLYRATPHWDAFETHLLPASDLATTLDANRDGTLWVGSICAPTYTFDPDTGAFTLATERFPGLKVPDCPMRFLEQRDGKHWIGTFPLDGSSQGLTRYDPDTETTRVYTSGPDAVAAAPQSRRVRALLEDRQGRLWIGGEEGLDRYDPETDTFVHYNHDPDDDATLGSNVVWSLAEAEDGAIWVGAGGLNRLDPETGLVTRLPRAPTSGADSLADAISWIHRSQREPGILWLATYDRGLIRFDPKSEQITRFGPLEGLPDNYVKAILEDDHGRIWAPTQEGLARLDPATREIRTFTEADGLRSRTFGLYDAVALPDGRFVLSHLDALVVFHPDSVGTAPREAPLALTSFRVFDQSVPIAETIRLDHDDDFFSFEFAALDFTAPEQTRYAYRLDGFDDAWVESGTRRYAAYTNLPPGRYTFRARADIGGGWGERELSVPVVIAPAWWQTTAFRILAGLAALVGLVVTVRALSTRRLRQQLQRLEVQQRLQAERERISQDLHDHVGAQLSTIISGIDLARLSASGDGAAVENPLDYVEARARQTMSQLRETIWAIHRESVSVQAFHERLCAYAREQVASSANAPEVHCTLALDERDEPSRERALSPAQTLHLYRIAQEAVQNALKHADAERIDVRLRVEGNTLSLEIEDDGRFNAPSERDEADALSGYGLAGMQKRADDLGAHFSLHTERGTRICVTVSLTPSDGAPPAPGVA